MIWSYQSRRPVEVEVPQFRIDQHRHTSVSERQNTTQDARRYDALIVIGHDESMGAGEHILQDTVDAILHHGVDGRTLLAVGTDDQLIVRNDTGLGG